jgi:hypothetical protein
MAWENRGNHQYYYRKRRKGDRVVSEYIGKGIIAALVSEQVEMERGQRTEVQRKWEAEKAELKELDTELDQVEGLIRTLTQAILIDAGYHPHKGQWRKKRDKKGSGISTKY